MAKTFNVLTRGEMVETSPIIINDRPITVQKRTRKIVWFNFEEICSVPRSQKDYLAIAKEFSTVFISDIPIIDSQDKDKICLFISLIDVFYDARMKLVFSAAQPIEKLYSHGHRILEYTRTHSRLLEMQSTDYFADEFDHYQENK
jgi:cell division protein ZapE